MEKLTDLLRERRKKKIIITSGGKNITPSNIENLLKNHPLIEQALVHGDRRKYLTALIGISPEKAMEWASSKGLKGLDYKEILRQPELQKEIEHLVGNVNRRLARFETIKRFAILPRLLEVEKGELTPTLKVRRHVVEERFRALLDSLYPQE